MNILLSVEVKNWFKTHQDEQPTKKQKETPTKKKKRSVGVHMRTPRQIGRYICIYTYIERQRYIPEREFSAFSTPAEKQKEAVFCRLPHPQKTFIIFIFFSERKVEK